MGCLAVWCGVVWCAVVYSVGWRLSAVRMLLRCICALLSCTAKVLLLYRRFMSNLVMVQYIEQGPLLLAQILQIIPSFNL